MFYCWNTFLSWWRFLVLFVLLSTFSFLLFFNLELTLSSFFPLLLFLSLSLFLSVCSRHPFSCSSVWFLIASALTESESCKHISAASVAAVDLTDCQSDSLCATDMQQSFDTRETARVQANQHVNWFPCLMSFCCKHHDTTVKGFSKHASPNLKYMCRI